MLRRGELAGEAAALHKRRSGLCEICSHCSVLEPSERGLPLGLLLSFTHRGKGGDGRSQRWAPRVLIQGRVWPGQLLTWAVNGKLLHRLLED